MPNAHSVMLSFVHINVVDDQSCMLNKLNTQSAGLTLHFSQSVPTKICNRDSFSPIVAKTSQVNVYYKGYAEEIFYSNYQGNGEKEFRILFTFHTVSTFILCFSVCLSVCLFVCLSVRLSVCLSPPPPLSLSCPLSLSVCL